MSIDQGVVAARELGKLTAHGDDERGWAVAHAKMNLICAVFREFVSPERHEEMLARLEGSQLAVIESSPADGDDDFDPVDDEGFEDEDWENG